MTAEPVRILICDDQAVVREGLAAILSTAPSITVSGLAANGQESLDHLAHDPVDVVLMDLNMPVMNGVQATRRIKESYPDISVLVLTTYASDDWLFDAIRAGATGYLLKDTRRDDLVRALEQAAEGRAQLSPDIASRLMKHALRHSRHLDIAAASSVALTPREEEVLLLVTKGQTNNQIAAVLELSTGTVRNYVSEILAKLGVSDRTRAAVVAIEQGLVSDGEPDG